VQCLPMWHEYMALQVTSCARLSFKETIGDELSNTQMLRISKYLKDSINAIPTDLLDSYWTLQHFVLNISILSSS
jgi:hypothetical protein